ncbi:MAG: SPFH domain-containing protein [Planctomycetota bacterium]|nr:SPFH domain-containing protein [Planctomycetota bacterium]
MGIFDAIKEKALGQFIDVIDWVDDARNTLVWKFPRGDNEIKNGAQLIVRESQAAAFLHEGELGDVFGPGRVQLTTSNIPILTTLKSWKYAFNAPFKCDVYFINTRQFTDQKWGTQNPIMLRDAEFGPIRLRAFGSYAFQITKEGAGKFIRQMAGTTPDLQTEEIVGQLRNIIAARFADALGEAKIPALDLAAQYNEMGDFLRAKMQPDFDEYGITLTKFLLENVSLPPEVEQALDKRTQMGILGDLNKYTQFQAANALGDAAKNQGMAGNMMGMFAGMNLGQMTAGNLGAAQAVSAPQIAAVGAGAGVPPPLPGAAPAINWFVGINGQQQGPFDAANLQTQIAAGKIARDTLVWHAALSGWTKAGEIADLAPAFGNVPPPLPGA